MKADPMYAAIRTATHLRGANAEQVVLSMVRRIVRAEDLNDSEKVGQIGRVLAALERVYAEASE